MIMDANKFHTPCRHPLAGLQYKGELVGNATLTDARLNLGPNLLPSTAFLYVNPDSPAAGLALLSNYISNLPSEVTLRGFPTSSDCPYLAPGAAALTTQTTLGGVGKTLILFCWIEIDILKFIAGDHTVQASIEVYNPLSVEVAITAANFGIFDNGKKVRRSYPALLEGVLRRYSVGESPTF